MTILERLLEIFRDDGIDGEIDSSDGTETLRMIADQLGPDRDSAVVMEICRVPIDAENGCSYYQFYTTIFKDLEPEKYPRILSGLNELNLSSVIGFYGILSTHQMVYHKYILRLPPCTEDVTVTALEGTVYDILAIIDSDMLDIAKAIV